MRPSHFFLFAFSLLLPFATYAQNTGIGDTTVSSAQKTGSGDTSGFASMLDGGPIAAHQWATATFKATRLISGHSIETLAPGVLDFRIMHRFGRVNQGASDFFGLDGAVTGLDFDYGITNRLMIGISRTTYEKEYTGFVKYKILRQTENNHMPVTLDYVGTVMISAAKQTVADSVTYEFANRVSYANQLLIARKFSEAFSAQLMPTHVHYNLVDYADEQNELFALGIGGRLKLTKRFSLNAEWYYVPDSYRRRNAHNVLSLGVDIETGGHVFQLHFTNSTGLTERSFIGQTDGRWEAGDIHFGFNISRVFTIVKPKAFRDAE